MRNNRIIPIAASFMLYSVCSLPSVELMAPDYVVQGNLIQIVIKGTILTDVTVRLVNGEGRSVGRADGFQWISPEGKKINVMLLGVSVDQEPGLYYLELQARDASALWNLEKPITVRNYNYPERDIKLTDAMKQLLTSNESRKKREAQVLWSVLNHYDPLALHHTETFINPVVEGVITSDYGEKRRYIKPSGTDSSSIHFGRDLWQKTGTPIHAAGRGRVALAADRYLTGNTVVLEHLPGVYTLYYHLNSIAVRKGEMVKQGAILGTLGATGFVTNEHLHWEMRVGAVPVQISPFLEHPLLDTVSLADILKQH